MTITREQLEKLADTGELNAHLMLNLLWPIVEAARAENIRMRQALESISKNSCCNQCQEAKLVALAALKAVPKNSTHEPKLGTPGVGFFDEQYGD